MSNLLKSKFLLGAVMLLAFVVTTSSANAAITSTLKKGSKGPQVVELQTALKISPADGSFGAKTLAAVKVWQASKNLTADGVFGAKSRALLGGTVGTTCPIGDMNPATGLPCAGTTAGTLPIGCYAAQPVQMFSEKLVNTPCVYGGTTITQTGPVTVSLATSNPASGNVIAGQSIADLAHFTFTGSGTVTGVTLQRTGISANSDLTNVYLFDGVVRVSDTASVNTSGVISFNNLSIAVAGSKTLSVRADIDSDFGGTVGVKMTGYTVTGSTTPNTVSIAGNEFYGVSATMGTVVVGAVTPTDGVAAIDAQVNAGTMNYSFWSASVTVGVRDVNMSSAAFQFIGSAPYDALANIKLYVNGVSVATASGVNAMGYMTFDMSAAPVLLKQGSSTLEVRADIMKGSNRTISLALQNKADLMVTDSQLGINLAATGISKVAGTVGISAGSVTVSLDPTFNITKVTNGVTGVTLSRYLLKAFGEDVKISYLDMTSTVNLDNVAIYANGGQISSNTQTYSGTTLHFSLGSSLIIPAGTTVPIEIRADTKYNALNLVGGTVKVTLVGYANNAQGVTSSTLSTVPATTQAGPTLNVQLGTLSLSKTTGFVSQNILANTANQKIGSFTIQAGASEGVHITSLNVDLTDAATTMALSNLSNLYIKYTGSNITPINPQTTNNFSTDITLPANGQVVVDVFADVGNSPNVSVVNVNSPTITPVATLANGAGTAASQTVDIAGTAATGQANPTITIGGYPTGVVQLSGDTAIVMAGKFVTAINANTNVNGQWVASNGGTATVTVRSRTVGTGPNGTLISAANGGTGTTAGVTGGATTILGGLAAPAQIETYTVGADIVAGNVYSITLNGIASTHTAVTGDTVTTVGDALRTAINANVTAVTATGTTTVIVTANTAGTAFTVGASTAVVGSRTTGGAIATKLSMTATGTTSNSTVTSSPTSQLGQTVTTTAGVLTPSTLVTTSSPTAQLVIGGSNLALATYHFVATNGAATIDELTFKVTTSGSSSAPIGNVTVNEVSSSPTYTTINNCTSDATHMCVDLNGLGIVVPVGSAGLDVPVTVAFNSVGTGNQTSGNTAIITLQDVYSKFGSTNVHTTTPNPASKTMTTVASKPTVTVSAPVNGVSALGVGYIEAIDVKVAADAAGPITMNSFTITSTPSSAVAFDALKATVYDVGGAEIATDAGSACAGGAGVACAVTVTLTGGRTIAAGTSETYRVFLSVNTLGATVSPNATINTKLTSAAGFNWTDTAGAGTATDGSAIYAFPATTLTVHN